MNWKSHQLRFLGLGSHEKDILLSLSKPQSIQDVARKSPIPRTTIAYNVAKLVKRGLIEKLKNGKRHKYYSIPLERFRSLLEEAYMHNQKEEVAMPAKSKLQNKKIECYQGIKDVAQAQIDFLLPNKNERVYAIQPNKSWLTLHSKVDPENVIRVNTIIRDNGLIIEGMIERDAYEQFNSKVRTDKKYKQIVSSFGDRMADYAFIPLGFLTEQIEMWIIKNTVLFIDWQEEVAMRIIDTHIANFLIDMFKLTKEHGRKIDHNESIRNLVN